MLNNKHITLFDSHKSKETLHKHNQWTRSEIIFKDIDTGKVLLTTHNKVLIAGSQFVAQKVFNLDEKVHLETYNTALNLDFSHPDGTAPANVPKVCLFCCGTRGCGPISSDVQDVDYTKRIAPMDDIVPFRYQLEQNDLPDELRTKYFGRVTLGPEENRRYSYYFKAFESDPTLHLRYADGTDIGETIYESQSDQAAETFVEMSMQITKDDFRDYFRDVSEPGTYDPRINSISLVTAWYDDTIADEEAAGYRWYQDICPFTQLNIPNESLIDLTKGIDITYHIYF